jgi:hypothetical protein
LGKALMRVRRALAEKRQVLWRYSILSLTSSSLAGISADEDDHAYDDAMYSAPEKYRKAHDVDRASTSEDNPDSSFEDDVHTQGCGVDSEIDINDDE